jgi:hypothetical protein
MLFRAEATRVGLSSWQNGTIQENDNADTQQIDHKMAGNGPPQAALLLLRQVASYGKTVTINDA